MELNKKNNLKFFLKKPLILVAVVLLISAFFVYKSFISKGATFGWIQSSWSGGATANTAGHENNQSGWTEFAEKDDNVDVSSGEITLSSPSEVLTDTTNDDFSTAEQTGDFVIASDEVVFKKPAGAGCASSSECAGEFCDEICLDVGFAYAGGKIASLNFNGKRLIAQTVDLTNDYSITWGCRYTVIVGADSNTDGWQNTLDIINGCSTAGIAARLCADSTEGGFDDWYLPARDELEILYQNRYAIGGFSNYVYQWSSTEYSNGSNAFVKVVADDSPGFSYRYKDQGSRVRCVRSLTI